MCWILILTLLSLGLALRSITAKLRIVQYEPMVLELSFSQKVSKPQFQLIFNNLQNIPYQFLGESNFSQNYYMQIPPITNKDSNLEIIRLFFNSPIGLGEGRLNLGCYSIEASKRPIRTDISTGYSIFVLTLGYLLSNFTLLGNIILEYCQLYVLLMFKSKLSTTLYQGLSAGLLLIPPANQLVTYPSNTKFIFECLAIPLLLIYVFGTVGYVLKRSIISKNSIKVNIIFDIFTYSIFINVCFIFSPNLIYNSLQFISIASKNSFPLSQTDKVIGSFLSYFSLITLIATTYLQLYILNPKLSETNESWEKYLKKSQFQAFSKLHQGINTTLWYTRNSLLLILLKKILIVAVFFTDIFQYLLIYLQFASLYYLFTVRPYQEELYMNIYFIVRLLAFIVYGIIVLGGIYFSLGQTTFNYSSAQYFLTVRDIIFLVFILVILGVVVRQIYQKVSNLNYRIRLVREQNEYKLQILDKNANSGAFEAKKNEQMRMVRIDSQNPSSHRSGRHPSESKSKMSHKNTGNILEVNLTHSVKQRKSYANMQDLESNIYQNFSMSVGNPQKQTQRAKELRSDKSKIWKEESLLQKMMKIK